MEFIKKLNVPILLLGGGGYTVENVARCWAYETSLALDEDLPNDLPITDFYSKYGDNNLPKNDHYKLHFKQNPSLTNLNEKSFIDELIQYSLENLKQIELVPNVDYNLPEEMYNEFNNELKSNKVNRREHKSEYYDGVGS